jgi:uncharacterized damage-inducible protein DinB
MAGRGSKRSGYTGQMAAEQRIEQLERSVERLIGEIERVPAEALYRAPMDGEWPVMSLLAHVAEILPYWAHQAEKIARAPGEPFGRLLDDPDRVGAVAQHSQDAVSTIVPRIRSGLADCLHTLRALPADGWQQAGLHPLRGTMTVEQVVDAFLVSHVEDHIAQTATTLKALGVEAG